jgi:pyridoxamine-phosphate oxidase
MDDDLRTRRSSYEHGRLDERTLAADPFAQFGSWLGEALADPRIVEAHAMSVSSVGDDGRPSARMVLLRGWDTRGFVFYTNYRSRKGRDLERHPAAALLLWWGELQRQIRIEGDATRITADESDAYFATRPRGHRLGASGGALPGRRTATAALGRISRRSAAVRILARTPGPYARPHPVHPRWARLDDLTPGSLSFRAIQVARRPAILRPC